MKIITTIEELMKLPLETTVYFISGGHLTWNTILSHHEKMKGVALYAAGDITKMVTLSKYSVKYQTLCVGKYDPKFLGKIMIDQLNEEIETIKTVYLK